MLSDAELALLDAIHSDRRSDAIRRAYAGWLEQSDPAAAAMIRRQLRDVRDEFVTLWLRDHGRSWALPKPKTLSSMFYRRGLPEAHWRPYNEPPAVRSTSQRLRLWVRGDSVEQLNADLVRHVAGIVLWPDAETIRRLADWPQLDRIEGVKLQRRLSDEARQVFEERLLPRLPRMAMPYAIPWRFSEV